MTKVWTDQLQGLLLPDWRKRGKILLASKLGVGGQDNRKGRGGGAEQSATYEHMTPFCKSFECLVDRWQKSQIDELPLLPASPANKTVISFKQFILGIGTFINSPFIFLMLFSDIDVKKYMADIGMVEESNPLVRVVQ